MPLLLSSVKQNYLNKKISTQGAVGTAHGKGASPPSFRASTPIVILSEAKNLLSRPLSFCPHPVILSEAKNLPSRLKSSAPKILRSEAPQNDRGKKCRSSE